MNCHIRLTVPLRIIVDFYETFRSNSLKTFSLVLTEVIIKPQDNFPDQTLNNNEDII